MAHCSHCRRDVGCGCNLINGFCAKCFSENSNSVNPNSQKKRSKRIVYQNDPKALPNNEFTEILNTKGLSREEKLKRINAILEKARQTL